MWETPGLETPWFTLSQESRTKILLRISLNSVRGLSKGWFCKRAVFQKDVSPEHEPERGCIRMFPRNENRNEGVFACPPETKTGTRAHPPNHPFTRPPCCLPVICEDFWFLVQEQNQPKSKFLGRCPADIRGSIRTDIPAQNFGQGCSKSWKNKHLGADIHDPKARTSTTLRDFQKLRSENFGLNFRSLLVSGKTDVT